MAVCQYTRSCRVLFSPDIISNGTDTALVSRNDTKLHLWGRSRAHNLHHGSFCGSTGGISFVPSSRRVFKPPAVRCAVNTKASPGAFQERYGTDAPKIETGPSDAGERWGKGNRFLIRPNSPPIDLDRMHGFIPRMGLQGGREYPGGLMKKKKQKGLSDQQRRALRKETKVRNVATRKRETLMLPPAPELSLEEQEKVRAAAQMVVKGMVILWQYLPVLLYYIPVQICKHCPEIHVGPVGHEVRSCRGVGSATRQSRHEWRPAKFADVFPMPEVYHLWARDAAPPVHRLAAQWGRVPAVMELCFQAGADVPGLQTAAVEQANGLHPTTRLKLLGISERPMFRREAEDGNAGYPEDAEDVINEAREVLGVVDERLGSVTEQSDELGKYSRNPSLSYMFDDFRKLKGGEEEQQELDRRRLSDPVFLGRVEAVRRAGGVPVGASEGVVGESAAEQQFGGVGVAESEGGASDERAERAEVREEGEMLRTEQFLRNEGLDSGQGNGKRQTGFHDGGGGTTGLIRDWAGARSDGTEGVSNGTGGISNGAGVRRDEAFTSAIASASAELEPETAEERADRDYLFRLAGFDGHEIAERDEEYSGLEAGLDSGLDEGSEVLQEGLEEGSETEFEQRRDNGAARFEPGVSARADDEDSSDDEEESGAEKPVEGSIVNQLLAFASNQTDALRHPSSSYRSMNGVGRELPEPRESGEGSALRGDEINPEIDVGVRQNEVSVQGDDATVREDDVSVRQDDVSISGAAVDDAVPGVPPGLRRGSEERRAIKRARRLDREKAYADIVQGDLSLAQVAENVLLARQVIVDNLPDILQWYDALGCRHCKELHVGPRGHRVRTCKGQQHPHRKGGHEWRPAGQDELFPPQETYHMDDPKGIPPQHLEIYPLKEFDLDGNFLFRHEPERKWTRWPGIVEVCVQAGAKAPDEVLERTNEFERMYIEQGKVMHRDQFTLLYNMLGYEAPHGDDAWSDTGPKNVHKPAYVIPGKQMASRLGGTRHIQKEGATFEFQVVDRWVRAGLRYDQIFGLEETDGGEEVSGSSTVGSTVRVDSGLTAGINGLTGEVTGTGDDAEPQKLYYNGVGFREHKDGLRRSPRTNLIRLIERIRDSKNEEEAEGDGFVESGLPSKAEPRTDR